MKKLLLLVALAGCAKEQMERGEAEVQSAKVFGVRSYCEGDTYGWTCMAVDRVERGSVIYRPQPIVVCQSGTCKKVLPEGMSQCTTMGVPR